MKTNIIVKRRVAGPSVDGENLPQPKNIDIVIELNSSIKADPLGDIVKVLADPVVLDVIRKSGCISVITDNLPIDNSIEVNWSNVHVCEQTVSDLLWIVKDTIMEGHELSHAQITEISHKAPYWIAIDKSVTTSVTEFLQNNFDMDSYTDVDIEHISSLIYDAGNNSSFIIR